MTEKPAATTTPLVPHRLRERVTTDRLRLDDVLDAGFVGTVSTVVNGAPWALPMLYVRDDDDILFHGSTGAGLLRHICDGAPMVLSVFHADGLVFANTLVDSSVNYRAAVVAGSVVPLGDESKRLALLRISESLMPGRSAEVPHWTPADFARTLVARLTITAANFTVKQRIGDPSTAFEAGGAWVGTLPICATYGEPTPAASVPSDVDVSPSVANLSREDLR